MNCSVYRKKIRQYFNNQNFQKSPCWDLSPPTPPRYMTEVTDGLHRCSRTSSNLKKLFPSTEKKRKKKEKKRKKKKNFE